MKTREEEEDNNDKTGQKKIVFVNVFGQNMDN